MDATPSGGPQAARILVVDDSRVTRQLVAGLLEDAGPTVLRAASGEEAFGLCLEQPFDLVVSDLEMVGISGVQLCRILRADPDMAHTPFLLLTTRDDPRSRFWSRQAGADDHLCKSQMKEDLPTRVDALLALPRHAPDSGRRKSSASPLARLNQVLERSLFEAVVIGEARQLFGLTGSREDLARAVLDLATQLTQARAASITLPEGGALTRVARVPQIDSASELGLLSLLGMDAASVEHGQQLILREVEASGRRGMDTPGEALSVALAVSGEHLGELCLVPDAKGLTVDDQRTAALLAEAIAPALRQLRLVEETQRLATTDELTGIANRRNIQHWLEHEAERAERYGVPLSVALVDVDHFKSVNDTHGHGVGDVILREVAQALAGGIRKVDRVGRWGGEEFLLVLADTPIDGAALLADRLRRRVRLATTAADVPCHVTVSIGVAAHAPGWSAPALVDGADRALYQAKEAGRDQVVRQVEETGAAVIAAD